MNEMQKLDLLQAQAAEKLGRVYAADEADKAVSGLQRALHKALCRAGNVGLHSGQSVPMCARAMVVAEQWFEDRTRFEDETTST